jgi:hypothetical protein
MALTRRVPKSQPEGATLSTTTPVVATLAAALNDPDRSMIGNPRTGTYAVSFITNDIGEATQVARLLASLGFEVRINCRCDETGDVATAYVTLYSADDQRTLFETVKSELNEERRKALEDLVLARGPIPPDILERIRRAKQRGWSATKVANTMNELGIIAGMGGVRWTPKKVRAALAMGKGAEL